MAKSARLTHTAPVPDRHRGIPGLPPRWVMACVMVVVLGGIAAIFWNPRGTTPNESANDAPQVDAREFLHEIAQRYRRMTSYAEHVDIRLTLPENGQLVERVTHVDFALQLPNQLRMSIQQTNAGVHRGVTLTCDGSQALVAVTNPETDDFQHQFVQRPAPEKWDAASVYSTTEFTDVNQPNELLSLLVDFPVDLHVSPIGVLLGEGPWQQLLKNARNVTWLPDQNIETEKCHRVRVETAAGDYVFWIAEPTRLIRRIEQPVAALLHPDTPVPLRTRASFVSHHSNVRVDEALASELFTVSPPASGKRMRHFVMPYREMLPAALGSQPEALSFEDCDGRLVDSSAWRDKVAVLLWFNDHPGSQAVAMQLDRVRMQAPPDAPLYFLAICTEPATEKSHRDVADLFRRWQISTPLVRDLSAVGRDVFQIEHVPTLVVLDRQGTVQLVETGANPQLDQQLPIVLEKIVAGDDIAAEYTRHVREQQRAYELLLASASWDAPSTKIEIVEAVIAPRSEPTSFAMERAWRQRDIGPAGNILPVRLDDGKWQFVVNTGWQQVAVLDAEGTLIRTVPLKADREVIISHFRTATDSKGKRYYAGTAALGAAVYLFDEQFQHVLTYPRPDQQHPGIHDVWLTDMNQDGQLELYVGFAGVLGLHCVGMDGQRVWGNRSFSPALSLTEVTSGRERTLLVTGASGQIDRVDSAGRKQSPVLVGSRAIHHLFASRAPERRPTQLCGLSTLPNGQLVAVGLTPSAQEAWTYPLPLGNFGSQIQFVVSGQVFAADRWDWVLAGPDGSLHVISDDGERHDAFHYGKRLHGLSVVRVDGRALLIVSTDEGVDAWWVDPKP